MGNGPPDRCMGWFESPQTGKNEAHPPGCASFLVDLKRFELSTPTMRMWCAPNCATSPCQLTFALYLCFKELSSRKNAGQDGWGCCKIGLNGSKCSKKMSLRTSDRCHWCGNPPDRRKIWDFQLEMFENRGGLPHQSADWFAMTLFYLDFSILQQPRLAKRDG